MSHALPVLLGAALDQLGKPWESLGCGGVDATATRFGPAWKSSGNQSSARLIAAQKASIAQRKQAQAQARALDWPSLHPHRIACHAFFFLSPSPAPRGERTSPPGGCTQSQHPVTCVSGLDAARSRKCSAHSRRRTYDMTTRWFFAAARQPSSINLLYLYCTVR